MKTLIVILLLVANIVWGQTGTINVDQNHTGHKIYGLPTPVASDEAATKGYADSHGGGGGAATWGSITGTLSAQTDLQTALDSKQPIDADLTAIAALTGTHNIYYRSAANTWSSVTIGSGLDFTGATLSATGGSTVTPAALTKTDDTNVTLTLGGTPATALLQATSLTLGWTGTLGVSRGGTGAATAAAHTYFGNNTGTGATPGFHQIDYSELTGTPAPGGTIASTTDILKGNGSGGAVALGSATTGKILKSNGTTFVASTETYAAPGTSGNVLTSDGTNWLSSAPSGTVTAPLTLTVSDAATTTVTDILNLSHNSSGTAAANYGTGLKFKGKTSTTNDRDMVDIAAAWRVATEGSQDPYLGIGFNSNSGGGAGSSFRFYVGGSLTNQTTYFSDGSFNASGGYRVNSANAPLGSMLQGTGSVYSASTANWPSTAGAAGYTIRSDGTNFASYPAQLINSSVSSQSPSTSDVYLAGSNIVVTAGDFKAKGQYKCVFDMTKSAGTGAIVITLRVGTAGTTADAAIQTYTFGAGTSVADTGIFEIIATWRTVGSGTSAVIQGVCRGTHQLATTGLFNNAGGWVVIGSPSPSSGFASNTATNIGISFNGSTAFAGTTTMVQAQLQQ